TTRLIYDARGKLVAELDAERYLTEHVYDARGNRTTTIRYSQPVTQVVGAGTRVIDLRPLADPQAQVTSTTYDALDRITSQTNAEGTVTRYAYDTVGNLVSTVKAAGTAEARTLNARFDVQGRLTGELSAEGAALLTEGLTQEQVDALWTQHGLTHTYDALGRRTSTTDANGARTVFFYTADGRLAFTINALGEVEERQYDILNQLSATVRHGARLTPATLAGLNGGRVTPELTAAVAAIRDATVDGSVDYEYTLRGELAITRGATSTTTRIYNAFGDVTSVTASGGSAQPSVQSFSHDRRGLQTGTVSDPAGINATTSARYDAFGRLVESTDANGKVSHQSYDRLGRVVQTVDKSQAIRSTTYDAFGRTLTQTNALNQTTRYTYDTAARKLTITSPEGISVSTVHNRHGQTDTVTDGKNQVTSYEYDRNGNLVGTTTPLTGTSQVYDRAGRLLETVDARGNKVAYTYDAANRVLTVTTDPGAEPGRLNLTTEHRYDAKGQAVWSRDANGVWTHTEYDLNGQVKAVTVDPKRSPDWTAGPDDNPDGLALRTAYTYDELGHQLTVTDPAGTLTRYTYDALGRRTGEEIDPDGLKIKRGYDYDDHGNLVSSTDANNGVTRYAYDNSGRLLYSVSAAGAVTRNQYDDEGRLVRSTRYATALSPQVLAAMPLPASAEEIANRIVATAGKDAVEARRYDRDDRLRYVVDGTGAVVEFKYDDNGNVTERIAYARPIDLAAWSGTSDPAVVADAARDRRTVTTYDALDRATFVTDAAGSVTQNVYDDNGNVVRRIRLGHNRADDRVSVYEYDAANRLTWQADPTGAVTRTEYDANGNVTRMTRFAQPVIAGTSPAGVSADSAADRVTSTAYDRANRVVHSTDAEGYVTTTAYDTAARTTTTTRHFKKPATAGALPTASEFDQTTTWTYDTAGRLFTSVDAEGGRESFTYDGLGNRKTFTNKNGNT
ncbi:RHS repeat protein, partial [Methylibium rhizosphaerae]|uniref:RHS repeat protein n=1 Tax=Methylibium rhizosphaerae TaxID=2570323 RepID=UPI00112AECE3